MRNRGITRDALIQIDLSSQSWEYASEMVLKGVCLKLRTAEVPVRFLKDREGRLSHMKRSGWLEPWRAGWVDLRAMLLHGADFFLLRPGLVFFFLGLLLTLPVTFGPVNLGPRGVIALLDDARHDPLSGRIAELLSGMYCPVHIRVTRRNTSVGCGCSVIIVASSSRACSSCRA